MAQNTLQVFKRNTNYTQRLQPDLKGFARQPMDMRTKLK